MTVTQQLIEHFIRTQKDFAITVSSRYTLYVDPKAQSDYDGTILKAQIGFPNQQVSSLPLIGFIDMNAIQKTTFDSESEQLKEIRRILYVSGVSPELYDSLKLIADMKQLFDDINQRDKEITFHEITLREINSISLYSKDGYSVQTVWSRGFDKVVTKKHTFVNFYIKGKISLESFVYETLKLALESYEGYFCIDPKIVSASNQLLTDQERSSFDKKYSVRWAKSYDIDGDYLVMHGYEIKEEEFLATLIIPIRAISKYGFLRAEGGAMVQYGYSKMPERERMRRMYVLSSLDMSDSMIQESLTSDDNQFIRDFKSSKKGE